MIESVTPEDLKGFLIACMEVSEAEADAFVADCVKDGVISSSDPEDQGVAQ